MTENTDRKADPRGWSTRAGTIKPDSLTRIDGKEGYRAVVVNAEGKENIVEAYGEKNIAKLNAAVESGKPMVFRGPIYMSGGQSHLMINHTTPQGEPKPQREPKPEPTAEEKAAREAEKAAAKAAAAEARAEAKTQREASRVAVEAGSVEIGGVVKKDGVEQTINHIGATFEKDGKPMAFAYFGELGAEMAKRAAEAEAAAEANPEEDLDPTP